MPSSSPSKKPRQHPGDAAVDDRGADAEEGGALGRLDLGRHAAGAEVGAGIAGGGLDLLVDALDQGDQLRVGVAVGVAVEETVDVGEDHQQVGLDQVGDHRREVVVVAEADLLDHHRVVLVDDRHDLEVEQRHQGVAGVEVAPPVGQVVAGQKDLGDGVSGLAESLLVGAHHPALADCRGGLLERDGRRPASDAERPLAGGHRPGRDQHDLVAAADQLGEVAGEGGEHRLVEAVRPGDDAAADLDHDPPDMGEKVFTHYRRFRGSSGISSKTGENLNRRRGACQGASGDPQAFPVARRASSSVPTAFTRASTPAPVTAEMAKVR